MNCLKLLFLIIFLPIFVQTQVSASDLSSAPVIATAGSWSVRRTTDMMTDKYNCAGLYKDRFDIQLAKESFDVSLRGRGGVAGIIVRYDEQPAQPMRVASEQERRLSIIEFSGSAFQKILSAKRLRVQVLTVLRSLVDEDIDLTGLVEMYRVITSQCTGTTTSSGDTSPRSTSTPLAPPQAERQPVGSQRVPPQERKAKLDIVQLQSRYNASRLFLQPKADAARLSTVSAGINLKVLEDRGTWLYIETHDDRRGWILREWIQE